LDGRATGECFSQGGSLENDAVGEGLAECVFEFRGEGLCPFLRLDSVSGVAGLNVRHGLRSFSVYRRGVGAPVFDGQWGVGILGGGARRSACDVECLRKRLELAGDIRSGCHYRQL
jgi:hypothetical protein